MPEHMLRVKKWLHIERRDRSGYSLHKNAYIMLLVEKKIELVPEHM